MGCVTAQFVLALPPGALGRGKKVCLSVTLSPPKPLDEIQPNFVCELFTWVGPAMAHFFGPTPWALGRGKKVCLSVTLSPPKPLDEIQPNFVCELFTWVGPAMAHFFGPTPWALGKGNIKVKYHWISITNSISKIFKRNFVCLLTHEWYITCQTGFSLGHLGHGPGMDLGVLVGWGSKKLFFPKFNQIWCVSYSH